MLRKLDKAMRNSLFHSIIMQLVGKEIENYETDKKRVARLCYDHKYAKLLLAMNAFPEAFGMFGKVRRLRVGGFPLKNFSPERLEGKYMLGHGRGWVADSGTFSLEVSVLVGYSDYNELTIEFSKLPKQLQKKIERLKTDGESLEKKIHILALELRGTLENCKKVAELRKLLPEFSSLYPPDSADNLPVLATSILNLKKAARDAMNPNVPPMPAPTKPPARVK